MGRILGNWRITLATLFSLALIVGAYMLTRGIASPSMAQASEETALLRAIATKDSNGDGLPDWEKTLYGIPINATSKDYFHLGMTDGEAVAKGLIVPKAIADISVATSAPMTSSDIDYAASGLIAPVEGTLTDTFSKNFFALYLNAKEEKGSANLSADDISAISNEALNSLSSSIVAAPNFKSAGDLTVSGSGQDALKAFAVNAETILMKNVANATTSELIYLQYAVQNNDTDALTHITSIAKAYRDSAVGLSMLTVPQELATKDLALVNAMMRVSEIVGDFARVNTDPLMTMLALQQYMQAAQSLGEAFTDIGNTYAAAGIVLPDGTPGASFVNIISDMTARQRAAAKNL